MTNWFIQQDNGLDDLGPVQPDELLRMVRCGEVTRETMLRKDESDYFAADDIGGLFEAAMRPTIQWFCPRCETEITEPPVVCPQCHEKIREAVAKITENTILDRAE